MAVSTGNAEDTDAGLATPLEVWQGLAAEGYQLSYRRVPLSRERTPEAADLDVLHQQLMTQPVGESIAPTTAVDHTQHMACDVLLQAASTPGRVYVQNVLMAVARDAQHGQPSMTPTF